jgi:hypothetical protein
MPRVSKPEKLAQVKAGLAVTDSTLREVEPQLQRLADLRRKLRARREEQLAELAAVVARPDAATFEVNGEA